MNFIKSNDKCFAPIIRDFLRIKHEDPPTQEEKDLYKILSALNRQGYLNKVPVKTRELGGPHFSLSLTEKGNDVLDRLEISGVQPNQELLYDDFKSALRLNVLRNIKDVQSKQTKSMILSGLEEAVEELKKTFLLKKKIDFSDKLKNGKKH